mmetsp:Transcript_19261/g.55953  ORF Transcript_19261/g.55953 Transcript_19261/m.55953 type:complete len:269 (-) Transcript_19261:314-1120(-)
MRLLVDTIEGSIHKRGQAMLLRELEQRWRGHRELLVERRAVRSALRVAHPEDLRLGEVQRKLQHLEVVVLGQQRQHLRQVQVLGVRGPQRHERPRDAVHGDAALGHLLLQVPERLTQPRVDRGHVDVIGLGLAFGAVQEQAIDAPQLQALQAPRQLLLDPFRRDAMHQAVADLRHARHAVDVGELPAEHVPHLRRDYELVPADGAGADELLQHLARHALGGAVGIVRGQVHEVTPDRYGQLQGCPLILDILKPVASEANWCDEEPGGA